jgi:hypothetical protein
MYICCAVVLLKNAEAKINELAQKTVGIIEITIGFNPQKTLTMVGEYGDLENISIVILLKTFPNTSKTVLFLCETFKMGKWLSLSLMVGFLLYGLLRLFLKKD